MTHIINRSIIFLALVTALSACQNSRAVTVGAVPETANALTGLAESKSAGLGNPFPNYVIGPRDELSILVFREPDLSLQNVRIDSSGRFEMPLIGRVEASGKTPDQLSEEIQRRYVGRFLVHPNVTINVSSVNSKRVTVEGAVNRAGVFPLDDRIDLLTAVALAGGPLPEAKLSEIAVFRKYEGASHVAVFDLKLVRSGENANPEILPGDIVVVGFSGLKQGFQDFLRAAPLIGVFTRL